MSERGTTQQVPTFPAREDCVLLELLARHAAETPDRPQLLFEDETWTCADSAREAWRSANGLRAHCGVEPGDYVSVWVPTSPDVLRAWFGTNAAGASGGTKNAGSSGQPKNFLAASVSSLPSGEPCACEVFCFFGLP